MYHLFKSLYICSLVGALAQLARAFDWQSRGHRFDSDMLHNELQRLTFFLKCSLFSFTQFTQNNLFKFLRAFQKYILLIGYQNTEYSTTKMIRMA